MEEMPREGFMFKTFEYNPSLREIYDEIIRIADTLEDAHGADTSWVIARDAGIDRYRTQLRQRLGYSDREAKRLLDSLHKQTQK